MSKFSEALKVILHHEGGYVNHPKDPGGETNLGVTKRVYEEFGGTKDMKELTQEDVEPIYKKNYWDKCRCDDLPEGLDLCVFDFAVNAGPGRAAKYLQTLVAALPKSLTLNMLLTIIKETDRNTTKNYPRLKHLAEAGQDVWMKQQKRQKN